MKFMEALQAMKEGKKVRRPRWGKDTKTMNFTAEEILPSLLDKTKTQTIRKAWEDSKLKIKCKRRLDEPCDCGESEYFPISKPAKFAVGDVVELVWDNENILSADFYEEYPEAYNSELGKVKITNVFKIEIHKFDNDYGIRTSAKDHSIGKLNDMDEFAKQDGFQSVEEMFTYFDDNYDLSSFKPFWVYRWEWI